VGEGDDEIVPLPLYLVDPVGAGTRERSVTGLPFYLGDIGWDPPVFDVRLDEKGGVPAGVHLQKRTGRRGRGAVTRGRKAVEIEGGVVALDE
jgi:hypothetical protein